eukprot:3778805-Ditylum_brightwellii.AAC.1
MDPDGTSHEETVDIDTPAGRQVTIQEAQDDETDKGVASEGENDDDHAPSETLAPPPVRTRSGQVSRLPQYILDNYNLGDNTENNEEVTNFNFELSLTPAKDKFYAQMRELNELGLLAIGAQDVDS